MLRLIVDACLVNSANSALGDPQAAPRAESAEAPATESLNPATKHWAAPCASLKIVGWGGGKECNQLRVLRLYRSTPPGHTPCETSHDAWGANWTWCSCAGRTSGTWARATPRWPIPPATPPGDHLLTRKGGRPMRRNQSANAPSIARAPKLQHQREPRRAPEGGMGQRLNRKASSTHLSAVCRPSSSGAPRVWSGVRRCRSTSSPKKPEAAESAQATLNAGRRTDVRTSQGAHMAMLRKPLAMFPPGAVRRRANLCGPTVSRAPRQQCLPTRPSVTSELLAPQGTRWLSLDI